MKPHPRIRLLCDHPSWSEMRKFIRSLIDSHKETLMSPIGSKSLEEKVRDDEVARRTIKNLEEIINIENLKEEDEPKKITELL